MTYSHILFSRFLRKQIGVEKCSAWCDEPIHSHFVDKLAKFVAEYELIAEQLNKLLPEMPIASLANPPSAMIFEQLLIENLLLAFLGGALGIAP